MNLKLTFGALLFSASALVCTGQGCPELISSEPGAHYRQALCFAFLGQLDAALREIEEYRASEPAAEDGVLAQVQFLLQQHSFLDAAEILNQAMTLNPRSVPLMLQAAELSVQLNNRDNAEQLLLRCTREAPKSAEVWTRLGDLYLKKQPEEAVTAFTQALRLEPGNSLVLAGLGRAESDTQEPTKAAVHFRQAVEINEKSTRPIAMVYLLYAQFLATHEEKTESMAWYGKALELDASLKEAFLGRAESAIALKHWSSAVDDLCHISQDRLYTISALSLLVKAYKGNGDMEKAMEVSGQLEQMSAEFDATKSGGNRIADRLNAAATLIDEGKWEEAHRVDRTILESHPEVADAYLQSARSEMALGRFNEAEGSLRNYLSRDASSTAGHTLLGKLLLRSARIDGARQEFEIARTINPLWIDASLGLAACLMREHNFAEAEEVLRKNLAVQVSSLQGHLMFAECLYKQGRLDESRKQVSAALAIDPADRDAMQMNAALGVAARR